MKKIFVFLYVLIFCFLSLIPCFAQDSRLVDNAGLLTEDEKTELLFELDEISERQMFDIVVVTENSIGNKTAMEYADDYYDYNNYGYGESRDGCLLLIDMESRNWYISTTGYGIDAISDRNIEIIESVILPNLSAGNYYMAFKTYAEFCDEYVENARNGLASGSVSGSSSSNDMSKMLLIAIGIGVIGGLIVAFSLKSQLTSVRMQRGAVNYIKSGSMNVTNSRDVFLYANVTRTVRESQNSSSSSTHTSSSGSSHGGGGGSF